jgi:hypothetical protein
MRNGMCCLWVLILCSCDQSRADLSSHDDFRFTSGKIYGTPSSELIGHWTRYAGFFGLDISISLDTIQFSYFDEHTSSKECRCFALVDQDSICIVVPDEKASYSYKIVKIKGIPYLLSDIEVAQYGVMKDQEKLKFEAFEVDSGVKKK